MSQTGKSAARSSAESKKGRDVELSDLEEALPAVGLTRQSTVICIGDREALFHAIDGFVRANCNFESSVPVNTAIDEIGKSVTLQEVFMIPLQRQLFNMDSALRWVLFLTVAPEHAEQEGDEPYTADTFSSEQALTLISQVYDIGVQEAVWEHFDVDEEEEEEYEDEEGDVAAEQSES